MAKKKAVLAAGVIGLATVLIGMVVHRKNCDKKYFSN